MDGVSDAIAVRERGGGQGEPIAPATHDRGAKTRARRRGLLRNAFRSAFVPPARKAPHRAARRLLRPALERAIVPIMDGFCRKSRRPWSLPRAPTYGGDPGGRKERRTRERSCFVRPAVAGWTCGPGASHRRAGDPRANQRQEGVSECGLWIVIAIGGGGTGRNDPPWRDERGRREKGKR